MTRPPAPPKKDTVSNPGGRTPATPPPLPGNPFGRLTAPRPLPARLQDLLGRAEAALVPTDDPDETRERAVERKVVGLSLEGEIRGMAGKVGGGLGLHTEAVLVCARVLEAAGELSRAAGLLSD